MGLNIKDYLNTPILFIIVLLVISLMFVFPVLNMVLLGAILAYGIRPIANKIQSKLKYSSISILLAIVIVLIPLILLVAYIIFELSTFVTWILANNPDANVNSVMYQISAYLPAGVDINSINSYLDSVINNVGSYILNYSVKFVSKFANITLDLFILVCSVFYFVRDGDKCLDFIRSFVPDDSKDFFDNTLKSIENVLKSIFYGHYRKCTEKYFLWTLFNFCHYWNFWLHRLFAFRISIWHIFRCIDRYPSVNSSIWALADILGIILYRCGIR